jgi:hypothetical protein
LKNGDLSNEVVPRIVLVFEGALGYISRENRKKFDKYIARERWYEAAGCWEIHDQVAQRIWYLVRHRSLTLDIVIFAGPEEFGAALEIRIKDFEELPVHNVWATRTELLARKIAYMPDLLCVYDPNPERWLTWGSKGRPITRAEDLGA